MTLPVHPPPAEGSLLSDYLIRLAIANGLRPAQLTRCLNQPRLWQRDPDRHVAREALESLDASIGLPAGLLDATSLRPLIANLHPGWVADTALARFIVVTDRHTRRPGRYGHPVCPQCLRDGRPMQRAWRLTTSVLCQEHGLALIDRCHHCGNALNHTRRHIRAGKTASPTSYTPHLCGVCGQGLSAPPFRGGDAAWLQDALHSAATSGSITWGDLTLTSHDFAGIVECLMRLSNPPVARQHPRWRPETADVATRRIMVSATGQLMSGGLQACLGQLQARGITTTRLLARVQPGIVPGWFAAAAHDVLSRRPHARQTWQGTTTFRFSQRQWEKVQPLLPPEPTTGGSKAGRKTNRDVLEAFLTRCAAGTTDVRWQGQVSLPTMRRRIRAMARAGSLDQVVQVLRSDPTLDSSDALSSPEAIRQLRRCGCSAASDLQQQAITDLARHLARKNSATESNRKFRTSPGEGWTCNEEAGQ